MKKLSEGQSLLQWFSTLTRWGLPIPLLLINGWAALQLFGFFESEVTAIITATLLSFLLAYPVRILKQRFRVKHQLSVIFVVVVAIFSLLLLGFTLIPLVFDQFTNLSARFPALIDSGTVQLKAFEQWAIAHNSPLRVDMLAKKLESYLSSQARPLSNVLLQLFPTAFESVLHWVLVLILTLYLLLHGDRFWTGLLRFVPAPWGDRLRETTRQQFQNYFVGQLTIALIVAIAMTIALLLLGVPFALVFGLSIGLLALFPFGKTLGVIVVSIIVSLQSIWLGLRVGGVVILIDQSIDNFITPILIGRFTSLNPIWILISLLFGVKIAGLLGLVLAVPVAGTIKAMFEPASPEIEGQQNDLEALLPAIETDTL